MLKKVIYKLLNLITLNRGVIRRINDFEIRFPLRYARYYASIYESDTFNYFEKNLKRGQTILDIGAHIGLYSVYFSKKLKDTGKVFCFEPTPGTFEILKQTVVLNKLNNCSLVNAAIADKSGILKFNLTSADGEGSNANSLVKTDRSVNSTDVKVYSIDDFRAQHDLKIDVLKIDVEGYELNALKGARQTFLLDKPFGILALHPSSIKKLGQSLEDIWNVLLDYNCAVEFQGRSMGKEEFCSKEFLFDIEFKCK